MKVRIKKLHPHAVIPKYAKQDDAGVDLHCVSDPTIDTSGNTVFKTGLAFEIPTGYVGLLFPRSSISKTGYHLRNSVGVIDAGYRGEVIVKFGFKGFSETHYKKGDRIAQLIIMPRPYVEFEEVDELSETDRGTGGFGSTGQ